MFRNLPNTIRQYLTAADKYGAKLDPKLRKEIDLHMHTITRMEKLDLTGPSIVEATYDALIRGDDPITATPVHDAITRTKLESLQSMDMLTETGRKRLHNTVRPHTNEMVAAFQPAYNLAGANLADAHAALTKAGITNLEDPTITTKGITAARANIQAREALEVIRKIDATTGRLLVATNLINGTPNANIARIVDPGDTTSHTLTMLGNNTDHWSLLTAGYTISLATPTETQARIDRTLAANAAELNRQDEAYKRAVMASR